MCRSFFSITVFLCWSLFSFSQNIIYTEMLGRPTNTGVTLEAIYDDTVQARVSYGTTSGTYPNHTSWQLAYPDSAGEAVEVIQLGGLSSDTKYYYKLQYRKPGDTVVYNRPEHTFHTARISGETFTFVVQADPHLDAASDTALYRLCLQNQLNDNPDFMIDLGDNFMTDKLNDSTHTVPEDTIPYRCKLLRSFYETVNHSVPLYLVLGNHEGECGWYNDGTSHNMAVWDTKYRNKYYTNPLPDGFYTGDTAHYNFVGQRESYYSWSWGDALFIVLDPFWFTTPKPDSLHCWRWTLGKQQYDWLRSTLENSTATFKFVFIHNLVGANKEARGGSEWANFYEWGGLNIDSTGGWAANRPGWYKPIKELLEENKVNIMFHGHDHFFDKQVLNCLVYQECPQPSLPNFYNVPQAAEYGYTSGIIIPNAGHIRVTVSPDSVTVKYIRAVLPSQETATLHNKDIACSYTIGTVNCYDSLQSVNEFSSEELPVDVYPNPFNNSVTINIKTKEKDLSVQICDINGRKIKHLVNSSTSNGVSVISWDGTDDKGNKVSDGIYFCRIISDDLCSNKKIILCK